MRCLVGGANQVVESGHARKQFGPDTHAVGTLPAQVPCHQTVAVGQIVQAGPMSSPKPGRMFGQMASRAAAGWAIGRSDQHTKGVGANSGWLPGTTPAALAQTALGVWVCIGTALL